VKNATEYAGKLRQLLNKIAPQVPKHEPPKRSPVEHLVYAFLTWESTQNQADQAYSRLMRTVVDLNDLRVSDPLEIVAIIGAKYERAMERSTRLKSSLNTVYRREHAMDLTPLAAKTKRDVWAYLESLEGMVPYVAAYVSLFAFAAHAVPVDDQLMQRLRKDGVIHRSATLQEVQAFLEHHIHFEDAVDAHYQLRAYVERPIKVQLRGGGSPKTKPTSKTRKPTKKKTVARR
jgi:endonuclease III